MTMIELQEIVGESRCLDPVLAAAEGIPENTPNRIINNGVGDSKLASVEDVAAALGYETKLVKRGSQAW